MGRVVFRWPSRSSVKIRSDSLGTTIEVEEPDRWCTLMVPAKSSVQTEYDEDEGTRTYYIFEPAESNAAK